MQPNLVFAFAEQSRACAALGSAFMVDLMTLLPRVWPQDTRLAVLFAAWQGDLGPNAASLPLRLAAGLHALVLTGQARHLAAAYPPNTAELPVLADRIAAVLQSHDAFLCEWVGAAPQTNETGRAAVLLAAAAGLARFGLPFKLSELGASAGLNLMFDQFQLTTDGVSLGRAESPVRLSPKWQGEAPRSDAIIVSERRGVDINPLNPNTDALRLLAYVWPDQPERIARLRAALSLAQATVDRGDAADWLEQRLQTPAPGQCHLIFHTIAYQYFPAASQARIRDAITRAGEAATKDAPIAWLAMEADGLGQGAGVTLQTWPQGDKVSLGRAGFHGQWVEWRGF